MKLPDVRSLSAPPLERPRGPIPSYSPAGFSAGTEAIAKGLGNFAEGVNKIIEREQQFEDFEVHRRFIEMSSAAEQEYQQEQRSADPTGHGFADKAMPKVEQRIGSFLQSVPERRRARYEMEAERLRARYRSSANDFEVRQQEQYQVGEVNKLVGTLEPTVLQNPDEHDSRLVQAYRLLDESNLSPATKYDARWKIEQRFAKARIHGLAKLGRDEEALTLSRRLDADLQIRFEAPGGVRVAIETAAVRTGAPADYLRRAARAESSFNPNSQAEGTTAGGLFQFTDDTWRDVLKRHGEKYGLGPGTSKFDPTANALMAGALTRDNIETLLREKLPINNATIYLLHFAGTEGGQKLLRAPKSAIAAEVLPTAAKTNKTIFYEKDGTARSVEQVFDVLRRKIEPDLSAGNVGSRRRFAAPGLSIRYIADESLEYGKTATANAKPFRHIVAHYTGGDSLDSALSVLRRGDPSRGGHSYGYHFYIDKDGSIYQGAPLDARTNHVKGPFQVQRTNRPDIANENAIGVAFVGADNNPTPQQRASAERLGTALMKRFGISAENVVGHGEIQGDRHTDEGMALVQALRTRRADAGGTVADAEPVDDVEEEHTFQSGIRQTQWFKEYVEEHGEEPDLNTTDYDYRAAWRAGARPDVRDDSDVSPKTGKGRLHWPSEFKGDDHPNRFVDGVDTKTGQMVALDGPMTEYAKTVIAREAAIRKREMTVERNTVKILMADDLASLHQTGEPVAELTYERIEAAYGPETAEDWRQKRARARGFFEATHDLDTLPQDAIAARLQSIAPQPGQAGYADQQATYEAAIVHADRVMKAREADPAAAVASLPGVVEAQEAFDPKRPETRRRLGQARLAAQEQIGIHETQRTPITLREATPYASVLQQGGSANGRAAAAAVVDQIVADWGDMAPQVFGTVLRRFRIDRDTSDLLFATIRRRGLSISSGTDLDAIRNAADIADRERAEQWGTAPAEPRTTSAVPATPAPAASAKPKGFTPGTVAVKPEDITALRTKQMDAAAFDSRYGAGAASYVQKLLDRRR